MNEISEIIAATADRLFEEYLTDEVARDAQDGVLATAAWQAIEEAGLPLALLGEDDGGFGLDPADALGLIRRSGYHAAPLPLGETMIANWILAGAGLPISGGIATFAELPDGAVLAHDGGGWTLKASMRSVPWARAAATIVLAGEVGIVALAADDVTITPMAGAHGVPRDRVDVDIRLVDERVAALPAALRPLGAKGAGALLRSLEMAGALRRVLELTTAYAGERVQFGKPIAKLQAIQQQLAVLAGQVAGANAAADLATENFTDPAAILSIAAAKSWAGEAAGIAAGIAHQVHGAIGFTEEHRLHLFTRSLWAWRDEFGAERHWQRYLGVRAIAEGGDGYWPFVTEPRLAENAA